MSTKKRWYREQICDQRKINNLKRNKSLVMRTINLFEPTPKQRGEKRSKKKKYTEPKQKDLNTRRKREYFKALVHCNFDEDDYIIHKTFDKDITQEDADRLWKNALERINRRRKKLGLGNARYILVMEGKKVEGKRIHFHIIIDGDLHRDVLEDIWRKEGYINIDRLQFNEEGITGLVKYITKELDKNEELGEDEIDGGSKSWRPSKGLVKPELNVRDYRFSKKQVMEWIRNFPSEREIEELYPGWICTNIRTSYCQELDKAYIKIEMRKYEENEKIIGVDIGTFDRQVNKSLYRPKKKRKRGEEK
ncbi:MAG: hypothetical protein KH415_22965 [Clostridium sp.]|nr:hypothetical protein [Clostridium sp.]